MHTILLDFSRVILKPKDESYTGTLNALHKELITVHGESYNVFDYFTLNETLLGFYTSLKPNCSLYLFTTDVIQNHPMIRPRLDEVFERIFAANEYGLSKKDPHAYKVIAERIGVAPQAIIYIDDQKQNIEAASAAGLRVLQYSDDDHALMTEVRGLLGAA